MGTEIPLETFSSNSGSGYWCWSHNSMDIVNATELCIFLKVRMVDATTTVKCRMQVEHCLK